MSIRKTDPIGPMRGIIYAMPIGIAFWATVYWIIS